MAKIGVELHDANCMVAINILINSSDVKHNLYKVGSGDDGNYNDSFEIYATTGTLLLI